MKGYDFQGPALELGALVTDGAADPAARIRIPLGMMNRHGLVAGATGTGKTKTLQVMAEQLAPQGVPVFLADIKGDLSGMASPGAPSDRVTRRAADVGQSWSGTACATEFFSLGGLGDGVPLRATMTSFGPTLLSKVLGLNETQESSLGLIFYFADKAVGPRRGARLVGVQVVRPLGRVRARPRDHAIHLRYGQAPPLNTLSIRRWGMPSWEAWDSAGSPTRRSSSTRAWRRTTPGGTGAPTSMSTRAR